MDDVVKYIDDVIKGLNRIESEQQRTMDETLEDVLQWGMSVTRVSEAGSERIDPMSKEGCAIRWNMAAREKEKELLENGRLIKWNRKECGSKRKYFIVSNTKFNTAVLLPVYMPAPKSQLKTKSTFTKFKGKII